MNVIKRQISMWRYVVYLSVIVLIVCGLTFILSSCMREIIEGEPGFQSGKRVPVNFTMNGVTHVDNEVVTRNHSEMYPETVVIPLSDGLCAVATVEAEPPVKTRTATTDLVDGTLMRIVAYWNGTDYHAHADYTVVGGILVSNGDLHVTANNEYKFVAYSYNSPTTLPAYTKVTDSIINVDPSFDLLWGCYPKTGTILVTESSFKDIPITMSHQFSNVAIHATTVNMANVTINAISDVSIAPCTKMNFSVKDSVLVAGADTILKFSPAWMWMNSTTVFSEPRTVFTNNAGAFQVNIGSLILNDGSPKTFANLTATFGKQLQRGVTYTVKVRFKKNESIVDSIPSIPSPQHFIP